jgi:hypothetical protein
MRILEKGNILEEFGVTRVTRVPRVPRVLRVTKVGRVNE